MNYYFLLEDEKSFIKILPTWLEYCNFNCTRVADITEVKNNNYVMQSGQGVTQLVTKALYATIDTIQNYHCIDKLIIILDAEDITVDHRKTIVWNKIQEKYSIDDLDFEIKIFVCNRCLETWLLGAQGYLPSYVEPSADIYKYWNFYNVDKYNPELMLKPIDEVCSISKFHFHYFHDVMLYNHLKYTKKKPQCVLTTDFFQRLENRVIQTNDLISFREFYDFLIEEGEKNRT